MILRRVLLVLGAAGWLAGLGSVALAATAPEPTALEPTAQAATPLTIEGRVQDSSGEPLVGARLELRPQYTYFERGAADLADWGAVEVLASTRSGRQGGFRLSADQRGVYEVWVMAKGFMTRRYKLTPLVSEVYLPVVQLVKAQPLRVRVVGENGQPLAGAQVGMGPKREDRRSRRWQGVPQRGVSDSAGKLRLWWVESEPQVLAAGAPGFAPSSLLDVERAAVTVVLKAATRREVVVHDHRNRPLAKVLARVGASFWPVAMSDEAGRLEVWSPVGETADFWLSTGDGRTLTTTLGVARREAPGADAAPPEPLVVTLPAPAWAHGLVVDAETKSPLADALVFQSGRAARFVVSDARGQFRLAVSPANSIFLAAAKSGYLTSMGKGEVVAGEDRLAPRLSLSPVTYIEGRVVDEQGQPVGGVEIKVDPDWNRGGHGGWIAGSVGYSTVGGRFRLDNLKASSDYIVQVRHPRFAPLRQPVTTVAEGPTSVELVLPTGHLGFGLVLDLDEQPVVGAQVELVKQRGGDLRAMMRRSMRASAFGVEPNPAAATDTKGRFEFEELGAGRYDLVVEAAGFAPMRVPGVEVPARGGNVDLGTFLLEPGVAVEGIVVDPQGEPVAEAEVTLLAEGSWLRSFADGHTEPAHPVVTDLSGFFALPDLRAGSKVQFTVKRAGFLARTMEDVEAPSLDPVTVVLEPSWSLSGRVLDADGTPITGAEVMASKTSTALVGSAPTNRAVTDGEGRFELTDLPAGTLNVKGWARGYLPTLKPAVELGPGRQPEEVELTLQRGAVIVGKVRAADGEPAAGARVTLARDYQTFDPLSMVGGPPSTSVDDDGKYRLEGVPLGLVSVEAWSGRNGRAVKDLQVEAGENTLDLVFEPDFEISGRVVDSSGQSVSGALVSTQSVGSMGSSRNDYSAADGSFTLTGLQNGSYQVRAKHESKGQGKTPTPVEISGVSVGGVEIQLAADVELVGRLIGLELEALARVVVFAFSRAQGGMATGTVDYEGGYRITGLSPGEWLVMASDSQGNAEVSERITIEAGEATVNLDLEFGGGLTLSGIVLQGQEPLAGQQVALALGQSAFAGGRTDAAGRFEIRGLKEGQYQLSVLDPAQGLRHQQSLDLSSDREIRIEVVIASVRGTVVDASDRAPLSAVSLSASPVESSSILAGRSVHGGVLSGENGQFDLGELARGRWRVVARKEGYEQAEVEIEVSSSSIDSLRLAMQPGGGLTFYVTWEGGVPTSSVNAAVVDATGRVIAGGSYSTREAGRVLISSVPRGQWELLVTSGGSAVASLPVAVPGGSPTVSLVPGGQLELTVADLVAEGGNGQLRLVGAGGKLLRRPAIFGTAPVEFPVAAGRASLAGLPPGSWQAVVTSPDGRTWSASLTAVAGQTVQVRIE